MPVRTASVAGRSLIAAFLLAAVAAQPILADDLTDARGNEGNLGSGAIYDPQTPEDYGVARSHIDPETGVEVAGATTSAASASVLAAMNVDMDETVVISGKAVHGEGDLLLLDTFNGPAVLRLPYQNLNGNTIAEGSEVQAVGVPSSNGILIVVHLAVWPAED